VLASRTFGVAVTIGASFDFCLYGALFTLAAASGPDALHGGVAPAAADGGRRRLGPRVGPVRGTLRYMGHADRRPVVRTARRGRPLAARARPRRARRRGARRAGPAPALAAIALAYLLALLLALDGKDRP
jgi:hypothetical protein